MSHLPHPILRVIFNYAFKNINEVYDFRFLYRLSDNEFTAIHEYITTIYNDQPSNLIINLARFGKFDLIIQLKLEQKFDVTTIKNCFQMAWSKKHVKFIEYMLSNVERYNGNMPSFRKVDNRINCRKKSFFNCIFNSSPPLTHSIFMLYNMELLLRRACRENKIEFIKLLSNYCTRDIIILVARKGNLQILSLLYDGKIVSKQEIFFILCKNNHVECLNWMIDKFSITGDNYQSYRLRYVKRLGLKKFCRFDNCSKEVRELLNL
jgi:hypothetical protein